MQFTRSHGVEEPDRVIGYFQNAGSTTLVRGDWVRLVTTAEALAADALGLWVEQIPDAIGSPTYIEFTVGCVWDGGPPIVKDGSDPKMVSVVLFGYHPNAKVRATGDIVAGAWLAASTTPEMREGELRAVLTPGAGQERGHSGVTMEDIVVPVAEQVWLYDDSLAAWTDATTDFGLTATDTTFLDAVDDQVYFGLADKFYIINVGLSAGLGASENMTVTWEYWNGTAWTTFVPIVETTLGFQNDGIILWSPGTLAGWTQTSVNGSADLYYVRGTTGVTAVTAPTEDLFTFQLEDPRSKVMVQCLSGAF